MSDNIDDKVPRVLYKRIATEAQHLLKDSRYEELRRPTDKDYECAALIAASLSELAPYEKADDGPSIDELTLGLTPELHGRDPKTIPGEEYEQKITQIERSINLLRKMALEALEKQMLEWYENPNSKQERLMIPFYIGCKSRDGVEVYYECLPKTRDPETRYKAVREFYDSLGFSKTDFDINSFYHMTEKGGGIIRYDSNYFSKLNQDNDDWKDLPNYDGIPEYDKKESDDMLANLKGDYTSERGVIEFLDMFTHAINLLKDKTKEDHYTDTKFIHDLMPESINATGAELEKYKTKFQDVLYCLHRTQNPSKQYLDAKRKEEYKRSRRLKTVKYINNSPSEKENVTYLCEVTYDKSTADKFVTSLSFIDIHKFPTTWTDKEGTHKVEYFEIKDLEDVAEYEGHNLYKKEPNNIEYRKYNAPDKHGVERIEIIIGVVVDKKSATRYKPLDLNFSSVLSKASCCVAGVDIDVGATIRMYKYHKGLLIILFRLS